MRSSQILMYLAEAGFMSLVFAIIGVAGRALWEDRRER